MNWKQITFGDRSIHHFKGGDGLIRAACGVFFNSKFLRDPGQHVEKCESCQAAILKPRRSHAP